MSYTEEQRTVNCGELSGRYRPPQFSLRGPENRGQQSRKKVGKYGTHCSLVLSHEH